jgi:DNA-binding PadR family transcriptional regulator
MRDLTELEGCVLGLVWELGPCTAYVLRQQLLQSLSPYWSGSAGAIYPLVARLERQRLVRAKDQATGKRRSKGYELTPAGLRHLEQWLGPPLTDETVGVPMDPLRTRVRFLGALTPARRAAFLADAEARMRDRLTRMEKQRDASGPKANRYEELNERGAVAMMRARLAWVREVAGSDGRPPSLRGRPNTTPPRLTAGRAGRTS